MVGVNDGAGQRLGAPRPQNAYGPLKGTALMPDGTHVRTSGSIGVITTDWVIQ